jgi:PadR family transcriptional regulator, regulatory protein PadR
MKEKPDVLQGTLALMVLKTLDILGPQHGYGIARRVEQSGGDLLAVNQGTLYPLLLKLEHEGSIASEWCASENNRRARFDRITATGRKQLQAEARDWKQTAAIIARFFEVKAEDLPRDSCAAFSFASQTSPPEGAPTSVSVKRWPSISPCKPKRTCAPACRPSRRAGRPH